MNLIDTDMTKSGICTMKFPAELSIFNVAQIKKEIQEHLPSKKMKTLKLDISNVKEMDTACLQLIVQVKKECDENSIKFLFHGKNSAVMDAISIYNMKSFFESAG